MQTPVPGAVPDSTPPRTTSKSKRGKKLVIDSGRRDPDQPSTDPTRLRKADGQFPSSLKKRRKQTAVAMPGDGAIPNPLDITGARQGSTNRTVTLPYQERQAQLSNSLPGGAASMGLTFGSGSMIGRNPSNLNDTQQGNDNTALIDDSYYDTTGLGDLPPGADVDEEHMTWGQRRAAIRKSQWNTIAVHHPEKALAALMVIPCLMAVVIFGVFIDEFWTENRISQLPVGVEVVETGVNVIHTLMEEQYAAQELQHFHVTGAQQAALQNASGVMYPYYPETTTPNYYLARTTFEDCIAKADTARKELWIKYLEVKDDIPYLLNDFFDEVYLEKTRFLVRSGHMDYTDLSYEEVMMDLLRYLGRIWFLGGIAPETSDLTLPLRVTGLQGRAAALEAVVLALKEGHDSNKSVLHIHGGAQGLENLLHETSLAESIRVRFLAGFVPEENLNTIFTTETKRFLEHVEHAIDYSYFKNKVWADNSKQLRADAKGMISLLKDTASQKLQVMREHAAESTRFEARVGLLILLIIVSLSALFGVVLMVLLAKRNANQEREIRDMEGAMDRMKVFVKRLADFDMSPLTSKVPRSAPQQELMLRTFLGPMRDLVDFIPQVVTYPPQVIPNDQLTPEGLWLNSKKFWYVPSLHVVRIDTTSFHSQFHRAGSKQRTVQHQSQSVLTAIHDIVNAYNLQLNIFTDHVMCYINLCDEVEDPAAVALSISFQVQRMCMERKIPTLRCAIAVGAAYVGLASTKTTTSFNCSPLNHMAVTGSVIAETEALCSATKVHDVELICTERVMRDIKERNGPLVDLFANYTSHIPTEGQAEGEDRPSRPSLHQDDVEYRPLEVLRLDADDGFAPSALGRPSSLGAPKDFNAAMDDTTVIYEVSASKLDGARSSVAGASSDRNPKFMEWKAAFTAFRKASNSKEDMTNAMGLLIDFEARYPKDPSALRLLSVLVRKEEEEQAAMGNGARVAGRPPMSPMSTGQSEMRQHAVLGFMCNNAV